MAKMNWIQIIRRIQLLFVLITLPLSAYTIHYYSADTYTPGPLYSVVITGASFAVAAVCHPIHFFLPPSVLAPPLYLTLSPHFVFDLERNLLTLNVVLLVYSRLHKIPLHLLRH
jgi:hypothetical protein